MDITDISKAKRVVPMNVAESSIHNLMSLRVTATEGTDPIQMPPVGTEDPDTLGGMKAVSDWIMGLP